MAAIFFRCLFFALLPYLVAPAPDQACVGQNVYVFSNDSCVFIKEVRDFANEAGYNPQRRQWAIDKCGSLDNAWNQTTIRSIEIDCS